MQISDAKTQIEKFMQTGATFPQPFRQKNSLTFRQIQKRLFLRLRSSCKRGRRFRGRRGQPAATRLVTLIGREVSFGHTDREGGGWTFVMIIYIARCKNKKKWPGFGRLTPQLSFQSYSNNEEGQVVTSLMTSDLVTGRFKFKFQRGDFSVKFPSNFYLFATWWSLFCWVKCLMFMFMTPHL